jgi:O-acetylserine/cysteine efflux transporter
LSRLGAAPPVFWLALSYTVFLASIFGHGGYYWLIQRHEVSTMSTLMLLNPVIGVFLGITIAGDPLTPGFLAGSVLTLAGAAILAVRSRKAYPAPPVRPSE